MQNFEKLYEQHTSAFETLPSWVNRELRIPGKERFVATGIPTRRQEDWHYTNVNHVGKTPYALGSLNAAVIKETVESMMVDGAIHIVTVNGQISEDLSNDLNQLPSGLTIEPIDKAVNTNEATIKEWASRQQQNKWQGFQALNLAFFGRGIFLKVASGTKLPKPVQFIHLNLNDGAIETASFPFNLFILEQGSEAEICETYTGEDAPYLINTSSNVSLAAQSILKLYHLQLEGKEGLHISQTVVEQRRDSQFFHFNLGLGGKLARHDIDVKLLEQGAHCQLNGIYLTEQQQHVDNHINVEHLAANTTSHQIYKGIMGDQSRGVFNGRIYVAEDAQQISAQQLNKNLLLSNEAECDTKPQLEISANDVKCSHGATVSQLNRDHLFYLQTRAISQEQAKGMLCQAFAEDVTMSIEHETIRAFFQNRQNDKIHRMAASCQIN
jgi:Fe-S cluster assembly protein SufD